MQPSVLIDTPTKATDRVQLLIDNIDKIKNKSEEPVYVHILFLCMQLKGMLLGRDKSFWRFNHLVQLESSANNQKLYRLLVANKTVQQLHKSTMILFNIYVYLLDYSEQSWIYELNFNVSQFIIIKNMRLSLGICSFSFI